MAEPLAVPTPTGKYTKVATAVLKGMVWIAETDDYYYHTYRLTGNPKPTAKSEARILPFPGYAIKSDVAIDVYIWCDTSSATDLAGEVRVDV